MPRTPKNKLGKAIAPMAKVTSIAPMASVPTPVDQAREMKWKAEEALRTIERAEEHKKDKGLMKEVKKMARDKIKNLGKIC